MLDGQSKKEINETIQEGDKSPQPKSTIESSPKEELVTETTQKPKTKQQEQIKLADGTNTTFDANNLDIRFEKGGDVNWGEDLGNGFSIGNDVYITDSKSLFRGKTGFVSGLVEKAVS